MIGTPNGPLHAGLLQAMTDGGFAAGFDDARTDEERLTAEVGITHPLRIALKVVFIGNVPDPRCSIANDNDPPAALQAAAHRFSINAR